VAAVVQTDISPVSQIAMASLLNSICVLGHSAVSCSQTFLKDLRGPIPQLKEGVTAIATGGSNYHCAIKNQDLYCWGGYATFLDAEGTKVELTKSITPIKILSKGVTTMSLGGSHACVIQNEKVKCWGINSKGQLGNNSTSDSPVPVDVVDLPGTPTAVAVSLKAGSYSCAIANKKLFCWGSNFGGQLGTGTTADEKDRFLTPVEVKLQGPNTMRDLGHLKENVE
jgi:alpha-tubulin suppressor-like RCC1 family protein